MLVVAIHFQRSQIFPCLEPREANFRYLSIGFYSHFICSIAYETLHELSDLGCILYLCCTCYNLVFRYCRLGSLNGPWKDEGLDSIPSHFLGSVIEPYHHQPGLLVDPVEPLHDSEGTACARVTLISCLIPFLK